MGEVSTEDTRDVMRRVTLLLPIERLAILEFCPVDNRGVREEGGVRTRGEVSKTAWRSRMRLLDPFTRNVPSISVATQQQGTREE
jgi:hypothetical protein